IVFDHLAHIPEPEGVNHPLFAQVRALIDKGKTWVKLSGAYADTKVGPPTYADSTAIAQAYESRSGTLRMGQRLAASGRTRKEIGRRSAVRSPPRVGARRKGRPPNPGRQPGRTLRLPEERVRGLLQSSRLLTLLTPCTSASGRGNGTRYFLLL